MTECERIIKERKLPRDFFKEETISDFLVTTERKKNWAVCIDLLLKFDTICRKHGLHYFVAFGSLLGIVRHKGFIPWDDDIDVCMLREDYDKLMLLRDEFIYPYFLQSPGYDNDYWFSYAKLRNSFTSGVSKPFRYAKFNQGIDIDIFPLDNCDPVNAQEVHQQVNELILENSANMRRHNPFLSEADIKRCAIYPESNPQEVYNKIESLARQNNSYVTDYVTCATLTVYETNRLTFKRSDIVNLIDVDFYGYKVPIPKDYKRVLSTTYGDYMQFPPIEKRGTWHNTAVFNPDVPYTETLNRLRQKDLLQNQ